jgi:hypothetical protein
MDYLCQQFGYLKIVKSVPLDIRQDDRIRLANRAMDVRSACLVYLAAQLKHDKAWLGMIGNTSSILADLAHKRVGKVIKGFFAGDGKITDAAAYLQKSVKDYRQAVESTSLVIGVETLKIVKGRTLNLARSR